jgi:hypothetical protein
MLPGGVRRGTTNGGLSFGIALIVGNTAALL